MVWAPQAAHGDRALWLCLELRDVVRARLSHPGYVSGKVHCLTRSDQCWRVPSTALAHKNVILVNTVGFLNYAFVSSLDQAFFDMVTNMKRFPKRSTRGFSSWIREWICSREQKCDADRSVVSSLGLEQAVVVTSTGISLSSPCQWEGEPGEPVRNVVLYGISCKTLCETRMWVCDETLPCLAEGHRAHFGFLLQYEDTRTFCSQRLENCSGTNKTELAFVYNSPRHSYANQL